MADHAHDTSHEEIKHEPGMMDVTEQEKMFHGFMVWTMRSVILIGIVLVFLAATQT